MIETRNKDIDKLIIDKCVHENISSKRCHLDMGWCGYCLDCGEKVHASMDVFVATGKQIFNKTKFHSNR